jgi:hypothetical protein
MNLTNETYVLQFRTKTSTEFYFRAEDGWVKVSARNRRFQATAEQVLNHLLPTLAGLAPGLKVTVEHYEDPDLRPLPGAQKASSK